MIQRILALVFFAGILFSSCGNNNKEQNVSQFISGASSKAWYPVKETNAGGDKEKLSTDERRESWVFYSNGTVSMNLISQAIQGRWTYDPNTKVLAVTPEGSTTSQTFTVDDIDENDMKLKAGDGSEMKLEAKE